MQHASRAFLTIFLNVLLQNARLVKECKKICHFIFVHLPKKI